MGTTAGRLRKWVGFGCLCSVVTVLCLCAGLAFAILQEPASCPEQERIKAGMTADEVEEVLGKQALRQEGYWVYECPTANHHPVLVHFDADGRVKSVSRFDW